MARDIWQIVDSIASAPTLRLDLNDGVIWTQTGDGLDLSPPPLKRSIAQTLMRDGSAIPASAYDNRVIVLPLLLQAASEDALATQLRLLHRELDRENNILKYHRDGATDPVFFRIFRSPDYELDSDVEKIAGFQREFITLRLVAEPFAYGLRVTQAAVTVNNDPAAGANGLFLDISNVTGDVETPAFIKADGADGVGLASTLAIRRHGTFANYAFIKQAESFSDGVETTNQVNDAAMSGAGNNYKRSTFATDPTLLQQRLFTSLPIGAAVESAEYRGTYRVYAMVRGAVAAGSFEASFYLNPPGGGLAFFTSATVKFSTFTNSRGYVDFGLVSFPIGEDSVGEGYSGIPLAVSQPRMAIEARRTAGATARLDWDFILFLPADEEFAVIDSGNIGIVPAMMFDGPNDKTYWETAAGALQSYYPIPRNGSLPMLTPDQTNRLIMTASQRSVLDVNYPDIKTHTLSLTVSFWPRFLFVR